MQKMDKKGFQKSDKMDKRDSKNWFGYAQQLFRMNDLPNRPSKQSCTRARKQFLTCYNKFRSIIFDQFWCFDIHRFLTTMVFKSLVWSTAFYDFGYIVLTTSKAHIQNDKSSFMSDIREAADQDINYRVSKLELRIVYRYVVWRYLSWVRWTA